MKRFPLAWLILLVPMLAMAQAVAGAAEADPANIIITGITTLAESAQNKNWALFIPTLVVLIVTAFRFISARFAKEGTKFRAFTDHRWTKWALNFATTLSGALIGAAVAKKPFDANLVINAVMMSFTAAGGVELFRDVMTTIGAKKPQDAGTAAAKDPGSTLNG